MKLLVYLEGDLTLVERDLIPKKVVGIKEDGGQIFDGHVKYILSKIENGKYLIDTDRSDRDDEINVLEAKIEESKKYLESTSWIVEKYTDIVTILETMTKEEFKAKYAEEFKQRSEARKTINLSEVRLKELKNK